MLASYTVLPFVTADILSSSLPEISRLTFPSLDYYLFQKLTSDPSINFSPGKLRGASTLEYEPTQFSFRRAGTIPKIRTYEKTSPRTEAHKRMDKLVTQDIIEHFWSSVRSICSNLHFSDKSQIC